MDVKDIAEQSYKNGYEDGKKETAREVYELSEKYGSGVVFWNKIRELAKKYGV